MTCKPFDFVSGLGIFFSPVDSGKFVGVTLELFDASEPVWWFKTGSFQIHLPEPFMAITMKRVSEAFFREPVFPGGVTQS